MTTQLRSPRAAINIPAPPKALTDMPRLRYWGEKKPPKNRTEMFSTVLSAAAEGGTSTETSTTSSGQVATIRIYGPIDSWGGWWGVSAADVAGVLDNLPDDVTEIRVRINSPGGEAWEGLAILNMLRAHRAKVVAVVDGVAASAASIIAVGVEETVMSPGTQMMIHDASNFAYGNADYHRKDATFLDSVSQALASLYAEAAGGEDDAWRALMKEETWYTAKEAVGAKLADRVAVVSDPGPVQTDTEEEDDVDVVIIVAVEDQFDLSIYNHAGRSNAPAPKLPTVSAAGTTSAVAPAPGDTSQEGAAAVFNDEQLTTLRQKLGVSADADADTVIGALDQALKERADAPPTTPGTVAVDEGTLAQLRQDAAAGREARNAQLEEQRVQLVTAAVNDGRIPPARKDHWLAQLRVDDEGGRTALAGLARGTIPVSEIGHAENNDKSVMDEYDAMFPEHATTATTKEA